MRRLSQLTVCAVILVAVAACLPPQTLKQTPAQVSVRADLGWQNSSIRLVTGQSFAVSYRGGGWRDADSIYTLPEAQGYVCGAQFCCEPDPYVGRGTLLGRIGVGGAIFVIGESGTFTASNKGPLYMRMNDCDDGLYDNSGTMLFEVFIPGEVEE